MTLLEAVGPVAPPRPARMTAGLVAGRVVAAALSFGFMSVVARELTPTEVGNLSLGLGLAVALSVTADLGLPMIVADRVGRHPEQAGTLIARVLRLRVAAAVVTTAVLVGLFLAGGGAAVAIPLLLGVSITATAVHSTVTAALRGLGAVGPDVANEVVSRVAVVAVGSGLLLAGHGPVVAAGVLAAADVVSAAALLAVLRRRALGRAPIPSGLLAPRALVPLSAALVVSTLHTRVDVWLVSLLGNAVDVAHYALPARVAEGLLLPAGVAAALILPLTSRHGDGVARVRDGFRYVAAVAGLVGAGAALVALAAPAILRVAFGASYAGDATVLRLLCLAAVPGAAAVGLAPLAAILVRRHLLRWMAVGLAANVLANVVLLPALGVVGAAWASVLSTSIVAGGLVHALRSLRFPEGTR